MGEHDRKRPLQPIPTFANREAEAEFWDTHDFTDYASFDNPVPFGPVGSGLEQVTIWVDTETLDLAREIAVKERMPWEVLLHLWLVERRDAERERRGAQAAAQKRESA